MNDYEIIEMHRHNLQRQDFSADDKAAMRKSTPQSYEEDGFRNLQVRTKYVCGRGHPRVHAGCFYLRNAPQAGRGNSLVRPLRHVFGMGDLKRSFSNPEPSIYEFTCPVESCKARNRVKSADTRFVGLPNPIIEKGYFRDGEI